MSGYLGGVLSSPNLKVLILTANPTTTATAGASGALGFWNGEIYLHLTAAEDTAWLKWSEVAAYAAIGIGAGQLVVTGPSGTPPTGLRAFEVVDADPNHVGGTPGLDRPVGSIVVHRTNPTAWIALSQASGFGVWLPLYNLAPMANSAVSDSIYANSGNARAVNVWAKELDYEDFQEAASDPGDVEVDVPITPPWGTETIFTEWIGAEIVIATVFDGPHMAAGTAVAQLGNGGVLDPDSLVRPMYVGGGGMGAAIGNKEDRGTTDYRAMSVGDFIKVRLTLTGDDAVGALTAGKLLVRMFYR
jgi:hypothetical protein